jgi:DNA-binding LacI/PurR family transcriptional regulator
MILLNRKDENLNYITINNDDAMKKLFSLVKKERENLKPFYIGLKSAEKVNHYRKSAFLSTCHSLKLTDFKIMEISSFDEITGDFIREIQKQGCNWICCFNDIVAMSLLSAASFERIPLLDEISISGFDNSPVKSVQRIQIDTIDLCVKTMGHKAGGWLLQKIIYKDNIKIQLELEAKYIKGNTIGGFND